MVDAGSLCGELEGLIFFQFRASRHMNPARLYYFKNEPFHEVRFLHQCLPAVPLRRSLLAHRRFGL